MDVAPDTVRAVLEALGVDRADVRAGAQPQGLLPPTVVVRRNHGAPTTLQLPRPASAATVALDSGGRVELVADRDRMELPEGLPLGYHRLTVDDETAHLVVAPRRCPVPGDRGRAWGWMVQLYAARSASSWGIGDLADLAWLARWGAGQGAGFVLCNPLHAPSPVRPLESSPYYPSSRRFANPLYLRVEDVPELAGADPEVRAHVDALARRRRADNRTDRLDRDAAWLAKLEALELLHRVESAAERREAYLRYRREQGQALEDFATFCALAEHHGVPFQRWPSALRHPRSADVAAARAELSERVELHAWLQWLCAEQLAGVQREARGAGMPIGILHDIAVGVDPGGADAWALQDDLAGSVTVGAPPDSFNEQGQDWRVPPLRPDRLAATGYAPFREIVGSALIHGGGVRIDHILGLFRLWWIPDGAGPREGTYVRYPAEDLLAVLALEATRAGALVVGEDLGTVERGVRDTLADWGLVGSRVLYFERDEDRRFRAAADYPPLVLASVTTHDLPPAATWASEDRFSTERAELVELLRAEGLLDEADPEPADLVVAMHAFLAATPCLLTAAMLGDAVGDRRQPNLPGTTDEHPNWRLPLAEPQDGEHRPVLLDELTDHPTVRRVVSALRGEARAL